MWEDLEEAGLSAWLSCREDGMPLCTVGSGQRIQPAAAILWSRDQKDVEEGLVPALGVQQLHPGPLLGPSGRASSHPVMVSSLQSFHRTPKVREGVSKLISSMPVQRKRSS